MKDILIFGYYGHQNIGDELFKSAFKKLFPQHNLIFTDNLSLELLKDKDALFFGGGSFLDQPIPGFNLWDFCPILNNIPIFYIGVGVETKVHSDHWYFLNKAKIIASRSEDLTVMQKVLSNVSYIPDLVYYQTEKELKSLEQNVINRKKDSVLILPNVSVLPTYDSPSWVTSAWENYKNQFAQFADWLIDYGFKLSFYSMCQNATQHDNFASSQIISMMKNRDYYLSGCDDKEWDECDILDYINKFEYVITQRYHGIVLSEIANVPVLTIYHHDKLKIEGALPYYEISKHRLIDAFHALQKPDILVACHAFDELKEKVNDILKD